MPKRSMTADWRETMILHGIEGAISHHGRQIGYGASEPRDYLILWPFLDYLVLYFQSASYITLAARMSTGGYAAISTLSPEDRAFWGLHGEADAWRECEGGPPYSTGWISVGDGGELALSVRPLPGVLDFDELASGFLQSILERHGDILFAAMLSYKRVPRSSPGEPLSVRSEMVQKFLWSPVRRALDSAYEDLEGAVGVRGNGGCRINLFAAIRYPSAAIRLAQPRGTRGGQRTRAPSQYPYTAALMLGTRQFEWLRQMWEREGSDLRRAILHDDAMGIPEFERLWSAPLGNESRSISDTAFVAGTLGVSLAGERTNVEWSRDCRSGSEPEDERRRSELESWMYDLIRHGSGRNKRGMPDDSSIVFMPLHVGGLPWITMFTISPPAPPRSSDEYKAWWQRHYYLYRDVLPSLANRVSAATQLAYIDAIADIARSELDGMRSIEATRSAINQRWAELAKMYPYEVPSLQPEDSQADPANIVVMPSGDRMQLQLHTPARLTGRLPFRLLTKNGVRAAVHGVSMAMESARSMRYGVMTTWYGHFVATPLRLSGILPLRAKLAEGAAPDADEMRHAIEHLMPLLGIAQLGRMFDAKTKGFSMSWLREDLRDTCRRGECVRPGPGEDVLGALRRMIVTALRAYMMDGAHDAGVTITIGGSPVHFTGDWPPFEPMFPFANDIQRRGHELVSLGLKELMRNACRYVSEEADWEEGDKPFLAIDQDKLPDGRGVRVVIRHSVLPGHMDSIRRRPGGQLRTDTVARIRTFEEAALCTPCGRVVETTDFAVDPAGEDWVRGAWEFDWDAIQWSSGGER